MLSEMNIENIITAARRDKTLIGNKADYGPSWWVFPEGVRYFKYPKYLISGKTVLRNIPPRPFGSGYIARRVSSRFEKFILELENEELPHSVK